ncbi:MAG: signal peptidase I [Acidimicrobiales bacterium]|jgi:signal peptidase I
MTVDPIDATNPDSSLGNDLHESDIADEVGGASDFIRNVVEWILVLITAIVFALVIRTILLQSFYIESGSMERTLLINDRVVINRLSYQWGEPGRGDIVVFRRPEEQAIGVTRDLIKRVIAIGGDTIEGREGQLIRNGEVVDEPYLDPEVFTGSFGPVEIPDGTVWVMGDNRGNSSDSRVFGTIDVDLIEGRAFVRYWPLGRAGSP